MNTLEEEKEYYIDEFIMSLQAKQKEISTVKMYASEIRQTLSQINQEDIILARNLMCEKGMKLSTVNKSISILSSFFKWGIQEGYMSIN